VCTAKKILSLTISTGFQINASFISLLKDKYTGVLSSTGEMSAIDVEGKKKKYSYGYRAGQKQIG